MKYVRTFFIFTGIWFVASSLNGILSGVCIGFLENSHYTGDAIGLSILCSFIFSVPLVMLVWLVAAIAQARNLAGSEFFRTVLAAAVICAVAGAVFFIAAFGRDFEHSRYAVAISVIISAISTLLLFRKLLRGNKSPGAEDVLPNEYFFCV